jgi:hypothetical protein
MAPTSTSSTTATPARRQYTSFAFQQGLDDHHVLGSIGSVGDAYDNALAESFVDTFKTELLADRIWRTRTQLELAIVEWVAWFNTDRLHESLGDIPPAEFETLSSSSTLHLCLSESRVKPTNPVSAEPSPPQTESSNATANAARGRARHVRKAHADNGTFRGMSEEDVDMPNRGFATPFGETISMPPHEEAQTRVASRTDRGRTSPNGRVRQRAASRRAPSARAARQAGRPGSPRQRRR